MMCASVCVCVRVFVRVRVQTGEGMMWPTADIRYSKWRVAFWPSPAGGATCSFSLMKNNLTGFDKL